MGPSPHLWFYASQKSAFSTRIAYLYVSQASPVDFVHSKRRTLASWITCLYLIPALIWGFCMQTSDFWTKIACLYGPQTSPVMFCILNSVPSIRITILYGAQPSSAVFACKTAPLGLELQVSVGPRSHLWFLHSKQRLLDQNTSLYLSQTWPDDLCMKNSVISTWITSV